MSSKYPDRIKGELGEQEACARLKRALLAHATQYSGYHDRGIDLSLQFPAPGDPRSPLQIGAQVKTGHSYTVDVGRRWKICGIDVDDFNRWRRSRVPVVFVWVCPTTPAECYWAVIRKNTSLSHFSISKKAIVSPGMGPLLALEFLRDFDCRKEILGRRLCPPLNKLLRDYAREYYWTNLLGTRRTHSLLGDITFSQAAWRHITRRRRSKPQILGSLELLPLVSMLLDELHSFIGGRFLKTLVRRNQIVERRLLAFKHRGVHIAGRTPADITIVLREHVTYPKEWANSVTLHHQVKRRLHFYSIYEKPIHGR